jgi:hypothetical protein
MHVITGENPWGRDVTKRVSQGLALRPKEFGIIGVWWGCVAATVISVVLLLTKGLWLPRRDLRLKQTAMKPKGFGGLASLISWPCSLVRCGSEHRYCLTAFGTMRNTA